MQPISAFEAASFFESNANALYLDVRTVAEFALGHPKLRCMNIPVIFRYPANEEILDNEAFLLVVAHSLTEADALVVGSERNVRAHKACEILKSSGFPNIKLLKDGHLGWVKAGMATSGDNRDGVSYATLLTGARRAKK